MRIELDASHFDGGVGDFDIGHVLFDTQSEREVKNHSVFRIRPRLTRPQARNTRPSTCISQARTKSGGIIAFDDLERAVYRERTILPVSPAWFVEEVNGEADAKAEAEAETLREKAEAAANKRILADIKAKSEQRDIEHWSDTELFAKVSGAPLAIAENVLVSYEGNLARMANSTPEAVATHRAS